MATQQTVAQRLYDLLVTRGFDPKTKNPKTGRDDPPGEARVMSFDYVSSSGRNYGTAVVILGDDQELMLFFGDNLGRGMEPEDKDEWYQFLQQLSQFATRNDFSTFTPLNLNQLKHHMAGVAAIKEGLFEGYYGTRQVSYMGEPTQARLMIRHNRALGEGDARHRHIQALFIETQDGERFRLPFVSLVGGRAMLEHVRQGGRPYDIRGAHIANMIQEAKLLSRFRRASQGRVLEGVTQEVATRADAYYQNLRENLRSLAHARGYQTYFETWQPDEPAQSDALVEDLKQLFVEQTLDARIEEALPLLARIQERPMQEAEIFESWINRLAEGTWATPDTPEAKKKLEELLAQELPVGPDATNAIEQLYDIFGDDALFDRLQDLADHDPDADARFEIHSRAQEMGIDLPEPPIPQPAQGELTRQPAPGQQDTEQVDEQGVAEGTGSSCVYLKVIDTTGTGMPPGFRPVSKIEAIEDGYYIELDQPGFGMNYTKHNYKNFALRKDSPKGMPITGKQAYDIVNKQGVAEGVKDDIVKTASGDYKNLYTGRRVPGPGEQDPNSSYMTPSYMLNFYKSELARIAKGPFKYSKDVARLKSKIKKLEKSGITEGDEAWSVTDIDTKANRAHLKNKAGQTTSVSTKNWDVKRGDKLYGSKDKSGKLRWVQKESVAEGSKEKTPGIALSTAYRKDFDNKKPGHDRPEIALTGAYSKTGKPGGLLKKPSVAEGDNLATFVGPNESTQRTDEIFADRRQENFGNGVTADQLDIGDDVIITGAVKFEGATGVIDSFGRDKRFVVVNLYNHGKHSFHSSDVEGNDYAGSEEEERLLAREDSTDPMDHRGAVTDSFYEDLARIKQLALSNSAK